MVFADTATCEHSLNTTCPQYSVWYLVNMHQVVVVHIYHWPLSTKHLAGMVRTSPAFAVVLWGSLFSTWNQEAWCRRLGQRLLSLLRNGPYLLVPIMALVNQLEFVDHSMCVWLWVISFLLYQFLSWELLCTIVELISLLIPRCLYLGWVQQAAKLNKC